MRLLKTSLIFVPLFFLSIASYSQDFEHEFKLNLNVSGDDIIENQVYSLLAREFRSFDDVKVVDFEDCDYTLEIIVVEASTKGNSKLGYIASTIVNYRIKSDELKDRIAWLKAYNKEKENFTKQKKLEQEFRQNLDSSAAGTVITSYTKNAVENNYHILMSDSDLENLINRIVADIDYEVFEDSRKLFNKLQNN